MASTPLIHRLNRVTGQIEAVKKQIQEGEPDCRYILQQIKAVTSALKAFGEAYVQEHAHACIKKSEDKEKLSEDLSALISEAFRL